MKIKQIIIIMSVLILIHINNISYADVLKGDEAYNAFRIKDYKNIKYNIDTNSTDKYYNHTNAWKNAIDTFSKDTFEEIKFINSKKSDAIISMTSINSSKEEWLGLSKSTIYTNENNESYLTKSEDYLNQYTIKLFNLSKEHINEVALHELGHSFGLNHQPQEYAHKTIMKPYVDPNIPSDGVLKPIDRYNLLYSYSSNNDWKDHWASKNISYAIDNGWIDKTSYFRPKDSITRAEFVEIIDRKFNLKKSSGRVFKDTINHWAKEEIDIAVTNKVCIGTSDYTFSPDKYITREEAASMIANYLKLSDSNYDRISSYPDYNEVSFWAKSSLEAIIKKGYIVGTLDGKLEPKKNISRAEAIVILSRI